MTKNADYVVVILNPKARRGRALALCRALAASDPRCQVQITEAPDHATELACAAVSRGAGRIVAAGGDGTLNEVLNGVAESGVPIAILPFGSVNVLARDLGIPMRPDRAWSIAISAAPKNMDLVKTEFLANGANRIRYFAQLAGIGMDAEVVRRVTPSFKQKWGPLSYVFAYLSAAARYRVRLQVRLDDAPAIEAGSLLAGNGRYYGGPFKFFPRADQRDGRVDVQIFRSGGFLETAAFLIGVGTHLGSRISAVQYRQARRIEIRSSDEVPVELDGEFVGYCPATLTVVPGALKMVAP